MKRQTKGHSNYNTHFKQLLSTGEIEVEVSIENSQQSFVNISQNLLQQLLANPEKLQAFIRILPQDIRQTLLKKTKIIGLGNIKNALQTVIHVRDPIKLFTVSSTWHLPQQPENFTGRKVLLKQLNQYFSKSLIKNAPIVFTACHGLGGVGKSYLALKFAYDRLMSNCEIRQRIGAPSDEEKQAIVAGKLLLIIRDENEQNILQLGFCNASTQSYRQEKIRNKTLLTQLIESPTKIIELEVRQTIFKYAKGCGAISHYQHIFWFNAQDKDALQRDYLVLAKELGFKPVKPTEQLQNIKYWLAERSDCLLIYDNVKNFDTLRNFLPQTGPHIIVTSRYSVWPTAKVKSLNVDVFTLEESREFIQNQLGHQRGTQQDRTELSETLGRLPLALAQACGYLRIKSIESIRDYLQQYQRNKRAYLLQLIVNPLTATTPSLPVLITWNMTRYQLKQESSLANQLLEWLTCVHHQAIPYGLCRAMVFLALSKTDTGKMFEPAKQALNKALACLKKYSLIQWQPAAQENKHTLSLHILLQDSVRLQLPEKQRPEQLCQVIEAIDTIFPWDDDTVAAMIFQRGLIPHLECLWQWAKKHLLSLVTKMLQPPLSITDRVQTLLSCLDQCYRIVGNYEKRQALLTQAIALQMKRYGVEHPAALANTYLSLGNVAYDRGQLEAASAHYQRALALYRKRYGAEHPALASTYHNLGLVAYDRGQREAAAAHIQRALALEIKRYGAAEHPALASTYHSLGAVAYDRGQLEAASAHYQRALALYKKRYGAEHPALASTYHNLGAVAYDRGQREAAAAHIQHALALYKKRYGVEHPALASTYHNLGAVAYDRGELKEAAAHYQRALALYKKRYGVEHPSLASTYHIDVVAYDRGELKEVAAHCQRALALKIKRYGAEHPALANTYLSLGNVAYDRGQREAAAAHYQRALALYKKRYGAEHPALASTYLSLGNVAAAAHYQRTLVLHKKRYGEGCPQTLKVIVNMGLIAVQSSNLKSAFLWVNRAYQQLRQHHYVGPKHLTTKRALQLLNEIKPLYTSQYLKQYTTLPQQRAYFLRQAIVANDKGVEYFNAKQYLQAIDAFQVSLDYFRLLTTMKRANYLVMADVHYKLGQSYLLNRQFKSAKYSLEQCLEIQRNKLQRPDKVLDKLKQKIAIADKTLMATQQYGGKEQKKIEWINKKHAISVSSIMLTFLLILKFQKRHIYYYMKRAHLNRQIFFFAQTTKKPQKAISIQQKLTLQPKRNNLPIVSKITVSTTLTSLLKQANELFQKVSKKFQCDQYFLRKFGDYYRQQLQQIQQSAQQGEQRTETIRSLKNMIAIIQQLLTIKTERNDPGIEIKFN